MEETIPIFTKNYHRDRKNCPYLRENYPYLRKTRPCAALSRPALLEDRPRADNENTYIHIRKITFMNLLKCLPLLAALLVASCHTTRDMKKSDIPAPQAQASAERFARKVTDNAQTATAVTARVKMDIAAAGKDLSVGGTLRMKKNEVVQLSLTVLGFEVGRLEFTPADVLVIDRVNKQYVRAAYGQVGFLRQAAIDFNVLQALFWNELFIPGEPGTPVSLQRFRSSAAGDHTLLVLPDAPRLEYEFLAVTKSALIDRVTVQSRNAAEAGRFTWRYGDFVSVAGKPFPSTMSCAVTGLGKDAGFSLSLSRIGTSADWETHTSVSSKYKQRDADAILKRLLDL